MCCTSAIGNIAGGKKAGCGVRVAGYGVRGAGQARKMGRWEAEKVRNCGR
jgi:hypothetical protein